MAFSLITAGLAFVYESSSANGEATFLLGGDWCSVEVENINPDMDYGIAPMVKGKTEATVPQSLLVPSENIPEDFFSASGLLFYVFGT